MTLLYNCKQDLFLQLQIKVVTEQILNWQLLMSIATKYNINDLLLERMPLELGIQGVLSSSLEGVKTNSNV